MPDAGALLAFYELGRATWGTPPASARAVHAALDAARDLADEEREEPAALLFAFASYRRAFPGAWSFMAQAIAAQHAHSIGCAIVSTQADIDALLSAVMYGT